MEFLKKRSHWLKSRFAGESQASALVALGDQCEEDFGFLGALLDVAEVVEDDEVEAIELPKGPRQREVALGGEQLLDELVGRREVDGASTANELVAEGRRDVALSDSRQAEAEHEGD